MMASPKNNMRRIMRASDIGPVRLAELTGLARKTIYLCMTDGNPTIKTAYAIANALGVDVVDIWPASSVAEQRKRLLMRRDQK